MFSEQLHRSVYFGALVLLIISLPYSVFTISVAQITLMVNWILEGNFKQKLAYSGQHFSLWFLAAFYLVHLAWMLNTSDYYWGLHDLRIKLPMLVLPLVIATSPALNRRQLMLFINLFVLAVTIASLMVAFNIAALKVNAISAPKDFFPYVSHVRLSLMVVLAFFMLCWLICTNRSKWRWLYILLELWFIATLILIQEFTGILIFIAVSSILLLWNAIKSRDLMVRWFLIVGFLTILVFAASYVTYAYARFHKFDDVNVASLEKYTARGNPYWYDPTSRLVENGHYINQYICDKELRETWNTRSKSSYDSNIANKGPVRACLIRYLTSKGLRKDAAGVNSLTDREISFIETGVTNYIDTVKFNLYPKFYVAFWELYNYKHGVNPTGYSISQRLEFLKTAFRIIQKNKWFGVGTGDISNAFDEQYVLDKSPLAMDNRLRAHNQLVTFIATFGIIGFLVILIALIVPPLMEKKYTNYLFVIIFMIGFLSFLTEDTLETHQGVSFFACFYSLFLFYNDDTA